MHDLLVKVKQAPDIYCNFESKLVNEKNTDCSSEIISFVNPYSYMVLRKYEKYYQAVEHYYSDAMTSSLMFSCLLFKKVPRVSFDHGSFAQYFLKRMADVQSPVYFIGAKENEISKTVSVFKKQYPMLNIVGFRDGYFSDSEQVAADIIKTGAEFVVCGMGTPYQEKFSQVLKQLGANQIKQIYTCGGFLHQSSEKIDYYPWWVNRFHLRWLFRAFDDSYVLNRLLNEYPRFFFRVLIDRWF
jgi:N-acetylglucosaminyldiphosphoundecaprenol N-acetyl-beta-D-mannosaminyltransferase